ncbi:MAG: TonB-dependent receptor [Betaproteobacteria bacterium HGW-Betaproteobacteria-7]|jgi:iron complex outermembrane receptor protein|nr:MAG: TonB-dependent receptor [Betaproteobacteria bacterium HGW-Betaproteobacteria-7]
MGYRIRPLAAAIAVAFAPTATWAEQPVSTPRLDDVVVNDSRLQPTPEPATLDSRSLAPQRAATSDAASLLRDVPGVSLYGAGAVSSLPAINGLADDRLRIKVDGMDLIASCPNHMNPALSYVDPSNLESLTVYAGISPVSLGGDSIGGSIIAETRAPEFAASGQGTIAKGELGAFYRSNNDARGGNASATVATENFSISYNGARSEANNYTAGKNFKTYTATGRAGERMDRDEVGSTSYQTDNHTLGIAMRGGNHLFEAKFGYQNMPEQLYPNQRMDLLDNEQKRLNLRYLGQFDWGRLEARAYHEKVDHFMDFGDDKRWWYGAASGGAAAIDPIACGAMSATCAQGMPMYTESKTSGASLKADIALGQNDLLRVGSEFQRYRLDDWWPASGSSMWPGTFVNVNDGERDRSALFGEWEAQRERWTTLLGVRYERVSMNAGTVRGYNPAGSGNQGRDANLFNASDRSRHDNNWDLTALARYAANAGLNIEVGLARKVRSPSLYEAYPWSTWQMAALMNNFVGDGNGYVGNPDLKPEKAHTLSATLDWHAADRRWEFKATPFYTHVTDYIDAIQWDGTTNAPRTTPLRDQFTVLRYTNQSARLYGLNLSGQMPLASTGIGNLGIKGLLSYTHGQNRDTGDGLYNIMPLNAKLTLTQKSGGWDNALELIGVAAKDRISDARNEMKTAGYSLVNLRGSYSWQRVRLDFGVENLFDRYYEMPLGGAYLGQGTTMSATLNNVPSGVVPLWGTPVPGMGRSLYAGVNVKF